MKLLYAVAKALRCEPPCCGRPASDSVRKPDAGKLHVRFDERDLETERFALPRQISTLLLNSNPQELATLIEEALFHDDMIGFVCESDDGRLLITFGAYYEKFGLSEILHQIAA